MTSFIYVQIGLLAFYIVLVCILEKDIKLFNPIILMPIVYFVEYGASSLYMVLDPSNFWGFDFYSLPIINKGLLFINGVFLFFILGYYSVNYNKHIKSFTAKLINKIPDINNYTIQIKNLTLLLIILLIVGWIARILVIKTGGYYHTESGDINAVRQSASYTFYSQYIAMGSLFPIVALALIFSEWLKSNKKQYLFISFVFLLLEVAYALPSGSKERILLPLAIILFLYSLKKKLPIIPLILFVVLFMFFVFPFVGIYRSIVLSGNMIKDLQLVSFFYCRLFGHIQTSLNGIFYSIFGERFNYSIIVSTIVERTPLVCDFKYGYTYVIFLISLIPRILWPGKPGIADFANDFGRDYGFISPVDYTTSVDMTWVGEMFINFGWFGVIVGFFYGLFYRTIYDYFMRNRKLSPLAVILYVFTLYYMLRGGMFAAQFGGLLKLYIVIFIIFSPFLQKTDNKSVSK